MSAAYSPVVTREYAALAIRYARIYERNSEYTVFTCDYTQVHCILTTNYM